jgi:hypothetical protein
VGAAVENTVGELVMATTGTERQNTQCQLGKPHQTTNKGISYNTCVTLTAREREGGESEGVILTLHNQN